MTEETTIQKRKRDVLQMLEGKVAAMEQLLPPDLPASRMLATIFGEFRRTPRLLECTNGSLVNAALQASQAGLEIGGIRGHGYIVPYRNKNRVLAVFVPGYKGLLHLSRQSGEIVRVAAGLVFDGDLFEHEDGLRLVLRHVPIGEPPDDEAKATRIWAVVTTRDGGEYAVVMWRSQIERIRQASAGRNSPAWQHHWGEMAKKTALRRALKLAPMGDRLERVINTDELVDAGIVPLADIEDADIEDAELVDPEPKPKKKKGKARSKMQPGKAPKDASHERPDDAPPNGSEESVQNALELADETGGKS